MSDQYGQQGQGGWQPQDGPTGWQPQPEQGAGQWQGQPQQGGWQGQPQQDGWQGQPQQDGWQGQPQQDGWQGRPQQDGYQQQGPQGGYPQGPGGWQPPAAPPKKRNLGVLITAAVVVLALAAGLTIWLVSKKDGDSVAQGGKATPQAAANDMIQSLGQKDAVGVAEQLDPTEAKLFADLSGGILDQLKRLEIVKPEADPNALVNGAITVADLTFEEGEGEKVSDNVTVVKLTGGKVTVDESAMNPPFTDKIKAVVGDSAGQGAGPKTYDIAEEIKKNDGEPIRIATVQRGDKWYPSMFYTLADNWLQDAKKDHPELDSDALKAPIAAVGGGSPEEAVQGLIDRALKGDTEGVIGMLPPDEMGVLYDYGKRMLAAGGGGDLPTGDLPQISNLSFFTTEVDGGVKVSLKSVTVEMQGQKVGVTIDPDAGTITVEQNGQSQVIQVEQALAMGLGQSATDLPPDVAPIITKVVKKALTIGFVTTEVDGKWYVSPLRSFTGVFTTLLEGLEPGDIDTLLKLAGN